MSSIKNKSKITWLIVFTLFLSIPHNLYASEENGDTSNKETVDEKQNGILHQLGGLLGDIGNKVNHVFKSVKETVTDVGDCKLDPTCYTQKKVERYAKEIIDQEAELIDKLIIPAVTKDDSVVGKYHNLFAKLGWTFISLFLVFHTIRFIAMYTVHEDPSEFKAMLWKLVFTAALMGSISYIFTKLIEWNQLILKSFINISEQLAEANKKWFDVMDFYYFEWIVYFNLFLALVYLVIFIQLAIRAAEIIFMYIVAPVVIATNLNKDFNLFPIWWRTLLSAIFTQSLQMLMLFIMISFLNGSNFKGLEMIVYAIGFSFLIIKVPTFLRDWMYSTGAGNAVGGAVRAVGGAGVGIAKTLIKRKG